MRREPNKVRAPGRLVERRIFYKSALLRTARDTRPQAKATSGARTFVLLFGSHRIRFNFAICGGRGEAKAARSAPTLLEWVLRPPGPPKHRKLAMPGRPKISPGRFFPFGGCPEDSFLSAAAAKSHPDGSVYISGGQREGLLLGVCLFSSEENRHTPKSRPSRCPPEM